MTNLLKLNNGKFVFSVTAKMAEKNKYSLQRQAKMAGQGECFSPNSSSAIGSPGTELGVESDRRATSVNYSL